MQGARAKMITQNLSSVYRKPLRLSHRLEVLCEEMGGLTNSQSRGRGTGSGAVTPFGCGRAQRKILSRSTGGMYPALKARAKYALSASHGV